MALNLGELLLQLGVDTSDLDKAQKAVAGFADKLENAVKGLQLGVDVSKAEKDMTRAQATISTATTGMKQKLDGFGQTASGLLVPVGALSGKIGDVAEASGVTNQALAQVSEAANKTGEAVRRTGKAFGDAETAAAKAGKATEDAAKRAAQETEKAAKATEEAVKRVAKEQEKAAKATEEAAKKAAEATEKATKKFRDQAEKMERVGDTLTKAVSLPLIALGTIASKSAIDFESAFAGVRKTVDATESQFKQMERGIRDMALRLPASTTEISRVAEAAGQLGVKREGIMAFTETMIKLGTATNLTADEAATALARIANIMGVATEDFDRLGATVVALGAAGASTEKDIVDMALRLASAGKTVGMTSAQVLGFANALSSVGIEAEAGGSSLSRVMTKIAKEVATSGDNLTLFAQVAGMSASQFATAFKQDAAGAIVSFMEGLGRLATSGQNVFGVMEALELSDQRVQQALLGAANAGDLFRQSLDLGSKSWKENTALNKEAEERYKTVASQIQLLKNSLSEVAITIGQGLVPAIQSAMRNLKPFLESLKEGAAKFAGMDRSTQDSYIKIGLFAVALGPAIKLIAKMVTGMAGLITFGKAAAAAFTAVTAGTAKWGAALIALVGWPALIVTGILAVVAAVYWLIKSWDDIKRVGLNTWGALKAAVKNFAAHAIDAYASFVDMFNKEEAARLRTSADGMREQMQHEVDLIQIREQGAYQEEQENAKRAMRAQEQAGREEDAIETTGAAAAAAKAAADIKAAAEAQTQAAQDVTAAGAEKAAKAQKHALDALEYKLAQVESSWDEYKAKVGEVATGSDYLARQKQYLTEKLGALQAQLQYLNRQYDASKAGSGEFSEATMDLGAKLASTRVEIARTQTELTEASGPIQDVKNDITELGKAITGTKDSMEALGGHIGKATKELEKTAKAVKELEDANKDAKGTIGDALGAMRDRTKEVEEQIKSVRQSTKDAQSGIVAAFGAMKNRASELKSEISGIKDKMKDLASVKLAGEGALEGEMADLQKREALARLALNALKRGGADDKDARVIDLEKQLDKIGLLKEDVQLRREVNIDPLKDQLNKLADDAKEMSFEDAKKGILDYQKQITDLTGKHKDMTKEIETLRGSVSDLVPKVDAADMTFDEAKAAVSDFKAIIQENAKALNGSDGLLAQHTKMKTEYDTLFKSLGELVPKIGIANLSFEEAGKKIGEMRGLIEQNNAKLDGPGGLLALQQRQKETVELLTIGLGFFETHLAELTKKEKEATSALEGLRSAAAAAASAMGGRASAPPPAQEASAANKAPATTTPAAPPPWTLPTGAPAPSVKAPTSVIPSAPAASVATGGSALDKAKEMAKAGNITTAAMLLVEAFGLSFEQAKANILANLPKFGDGAIVSRPTAAIVGEKGPEGIFPLPKLGAMMNSFAASALNQASGSFGNFSPDGAAAMTAVGAPVVHVYIGNREIYDLVVEANEDGDKRGRR